MLDPPVVAVMRLVARQDTVPATPNGPRAVAQSPTCVVRPRPVMACRLRHAGGKAVRQLPCKLVVRHEAMSAPFVSNPIVLVRQTAAGPTLDSPRASWQFATTVVRASPFVVAKAAQPAGRPGLQNGVADATAEVTHEDDELVVFEVVVVEVEVVNGVVDEVVEEVVVVGVGVVVVVVVVVEEVVVDDVEVVDGTVERDMVLDVELVIIEGVVVLLILVLVLVLANKVEVVEVVGIVEVVELVVEVGDEVLVEVETKLEVDRPAVLELD